MQLVTAKRWSQRAWKENRLPPPNPRTTNRAGMDQRANDSLSEPEKILVQVNEFQAARRYRECRPPDRGMQPTLPSGLGSVAVSVRQVSPSPVRGGSEIHGLYHRKHRADGVLARHSQGCSCTSCNASEQRRDNLGSPISTLLKAISGEYSGKHPRGQLISHLLPDWQPGTIPHL